VDGSILSLLDETRETVRLYQQLESDRGRLLFEFGLLYLGFALILILAAIWLGLWFAERLSRLWAAGGGGAARGRRAIWMCRCPRKRAMTKLPCWAACSTR
jgi:two-component system, NtrC family, nitrogen regulation sensor histidine kinase NtrY